jgi:hypothetical protein
VPSDGVFTITSTIFAGPCRSELIFQVNGMKSTCPPTVRS